MTLEELAAFLDAEFPQIHFGGRTYHLDAVGPLSARLRMDYHERHLRPGGTISGPSMMALAAMGRRISIPHPELCENLGLLVQDATTLLKIVGADRTLAAWRAANS